MNIFFVTKTMTLSDKNHFFCCKNKEGGGATEEVGATGAGSIAEHAHECSDGGDIHEKNEVDGNR